MEDIIKIHPKELATTPVNTVMKSKMILYKKICKEVIESLGASSVKDMGKIMSALKQKYSDSLDFSKVNVIVKGLLNK